MPNNILSHTMCVARAPDFYARGIIHIFLVFYMLAEIYPSTYIQLIPRISSLHIFFSLSNAILIINLIYTVQTKYIVERICSFYTSHTRRGIYFVSLASLIVQNAKTRLFSIVIASESEIILSQY